MSWDAVKAFLKQTLPENEYGLWIKPLVCLQESAQVLEIGCPDRFFGAWVAQRYLELMETKLKELGRTGVTIRLSTQSIPVQSQQPAENGPQLCLPGVRPTASRIRSLHPAYTFDAFMVGESNMVARSACSALARGEKTYGNCLFMNSATGLGKSHLTQAVVHEVMFKAPATRMHYLTAQQFSAEMVQAIQNKTMEKFSRRYIQDCDMLLVEDVHTIAGKAKTQEELNIVLDYLLKSGKRVILTSAQPPRQLKGLDEDFRSRMTSGLVTGIRAPEYDTRVEIVRHKAVAHDLILEDEHVDFLARNLKGDIRRTESAIINLRARSCLRQTPPDMSMVREVVAGLVDTSPTLTGSTIQELISCQFKVTKEELTSRSRKRSVTFPRQVGMYLTRKYTDQSLADIGALYNRDPSTVLHAIKVVTRDCARKVSVREQIELLITRLGVKRE